MDTFSSFIWSLDHQLNYAFGLIIMEPLQHVPRLKKESLRAYNVRNTSSSDSVPITAFAFHPFLVVLIDLLEC